MRKNAGVTRRAMLAGIGVMGLGALEDCGRDTSGDRSGNDSDVVRRSARTGAQLAAGTYYFHGDPLTGADICLRGSGAGVTRIVLADGCLVDDAQLWNSFSMSGVCVQGGKGAIRHRRTEANVSGVFRVSDCSFLDYTETAISTQATDMPYWLISGSTFRAVSTSTRSMGIDLAGWADGSAIRECQFLENAVHIRLAGAGGNVHVSGNDFIRFSAPSHRRTDLWIVPAKDATNSGAGLVVDSCKFGNENLGRDDYRIVYADKPSSGVVEPAVSASNGYITAQVIRDCTFAGAGSSTVAPVVSMTPHLRGLLVESIALAGTYPGLVVDMRHGWDKKSPSRVGSLLGEDPDHFPVASNVSGAARLG